MLAFPDTYYELIINLLQSVELFCAYDCPAIDHYTFLIKIKERLWSPSRKDRHPEP